MAVQSALDSQLASMAVELLDKKDQTLMRRCLEFVRQTPHLEGEFQTRIGVAESEFDSLLSRWPEAADTGKESPATIAINNALNEIVHGLSLSKADLAMIGASRGAVQALYFRWAKAHGWS